MMTLKASGTDWSSTLRKNPVTSSDQWMYGSAVGLDSTETAFVFISVSSGSLFHKAVLPVCEVFFVSLQHFSKQLLGQVCEKKGVFFLSPYQQNEAHGSCSFIFCLVFLGAGQIR